jgi:dihydrodipicolinate synthase/N-acetylneuraminate lyase
MHLAEGAAGFLTPAQAAEVNVLTVAERLDLIRFVQQALRGRAPLIAGATSPDEKHSFLAAEAALAAGCEIVLTEIPSDRRGNREATLQFVRTFASVGMPVLMLQDLDWTGPGLDVSWIVELFETVQAFRSLKVEVQPAGPKYSAVLEATGGRLHVAGGWAAEQMIEALDRGVDVYMATAMTGLYRAVIDAHAAGDRALARRIFHQILPVLAFTRQHLDISIQFYKRLFYRRGMFSTSQIRKECRPYDRYHESYGDELIEYLDRVEMEYCRPM